MACYLHTRYDLIILRNPCFKELISINLVKNEVRNCSNINIGDRSYFVSNYDNEANDNGSKPINCKAIIIEGNCINITP